MLQQPRPDFDFATYSDEEAIPTSIVISSHILSPPEVEENILQRGTVSSVRVAFFAEHTS